MQKKKRISKKHIYITTAYIFLALMSISLLYNNSFQTTGFVTYSAQPDATSGKDTYLRQISYTNYGTATTLKLGTATTGGETQFRPILFFDTSSITSTDTITSATISVYLTSSATTGNFTLNVYRLTSNWTETDSNWYNKDASTNWTSEGSDYNTEIIASALVTDQIGWYNFTITNLASDWIDGTSDNYGILLYAPDAIIGDSKEIASSDNADPSLRPTIQIEHVENAAPTINNISSDSSNSSPTQAGNDVTFQINWTDFESEATETFICNSTNITTSGCADKTFCSISSSTTNPAICSYTTSTSDNWTTSFYVAVCDSGNCSTISNENFFYVNHNPIIALTQPNGGETINQSQGNYSITFNTTDQDSNKLYANIYYGATQGSTTNTIQSNLNLTNYCTDPDFNTATKNTCAYSWNSSGIYGTYFLTIVLNDTFTTVNDSSDASFDVRGINDNQPPIITSTSIDATTHSGKTTQINATITDDNIITAWAAFNYTSTNASMTSTSSTEFNTTFLAPSPGTHQYKVYAQDIVGNVNSTEWQTFSVSAPNATTQNSQAPSIALPYHTILVTSQLNASNSLRNIYAYLNVPEGFTFLSNYPQNSYLGNFTDNETKTATWFLSVPIQEDTYTLNVTFSDGYSNEWNSSSMQIEVTSAIGGGYTLEIAGSTEVETTYDYYVESKFKQDATYTDPDTITISIYDASGNLASGPSAMTQESTGQYNFTYTVGPSVTEGIWETIINATKSGTSYYINEFWNVVGGPFDVRDITVLNSSIDNLIINVTTENTGGANKDLTLVWNLTREDTGAILHTGGETFMVPASSTRDWTIYPETTYVGQVRITMMGYYSGTEKAGAYEVFSTTSGTSTPETPTTPSGGGGGGGTTQTTTEPQTTSLEISLLDPIIYVTKSIEKTIPFIIKNTGTLDITNIQIDFENLETSVYTFFPSTIEKISAGNEKGVQLKLSFTDLIGEKDAILKITSNQITETRTIKIIILSMRDYFLKEIERLKSNLERIRTQLIEIGETELLKETQNCRDVITATETNVQNEDYILAQKNLEEASLCISGLEREVIKLTTSKNFEISDYWIWIITWILIAILILVIIIIALIIYKKFKLINFVKQNAEAPKTPIKSEMLNAKIQAIKDKLKGNS